MSDPISILGTALAVASVAASLSIKLSEIVKAIKNAPREVASIASELSMASSILCNVRDTLNRGSYLIKPHLMVDMGSVLCRFGEVNSEVSSMIDKSKSKKKKRLSLAALMVFKERQVKELMAKVESLKLSMNIIMNTVILAATLDALGREEKRDHGQEEHMRVIQTILHSGVENSRREIDKQQRSGKKQRTQATNTDRQLRDQSNTATWLYQFVFSPGSRRTASEENANGILPAPASEQDTEQDDGSSTLSIISANSSRKEDANMTPTRQKLIGGPENPEMAMVVNIPSKNHSQKGLSRAEGDPFVYGETPEVVERLLYVWTYLQERREKAIHERIIHASPHVQQGKATEYHQHRSKSRILSRHSLSVATEPSSAEGPPENTRRDLPSSHGSEYISDDEKISSHGLEYTSSDERIAAEVLQEAGSQERHSRSRRVPPVAMESSPAPSPNPTLRRRVSSIHSIHSPGSEYHLSSDEEYVGSRIPLRHSESEDSADEGLWDAVDGDGMDTPKHTNSTSTRHSTARDSSSHAYRGMKYQPKNSYGETRRRNYTPSPQPPPPPPPPPPPWSPPEPSPAEKEAMAQAAEQAERLKKLEQLLMQQAQARVDKKAAKKKAAEEAAAAEAEAKKRSEEDKLAKLHELIVAQREEQNARVEAIAAARAAEKAEADAKDARDAAEKQKAAEDAAKLLAAAKMAKVEAEAKAAEDAKAAKEAHEKALAEAAEELRQMKEEIERKSGAKVRPDFLSKLSRKWSSKGKGGV